MRAEFGENGLRIGPPGGHFVAKLGRGLIPASPAGRLNT